MHVLALLDTFGVLEAFSAGAALVLTAAAAGSAADLLGRFETAEAAAVLANRSRRQSGEAKRPQPARVSLQAYTSLCKDSHPPECMRRRFEAVIAEAQEQICKQIEELDGGATFCYEPYDRPTGGGGIARVLKNGNVFEKAGVNLSVVYGEMPQDALKAATERGVQRGGVDLKPGEKVPFFACGLSSVMHPKNPHCPTMHFNYRYFETDFGTWWFGGGTDITPSYLDVDDMKHFHGTYKWALDEFGPDWYPKFKAWADTYFYIPHRGETRGLGGIFFDDFNSEDPEAVTDAYVPIGKKNQDLEYTEQQKEWQLMRRGRYVEFNLVYDRGTIFGLKMLATGVGRLESILMSLPETARWEYCFEPEPGSKEAEIMDAFKNPREWV
ncbi:unnamed protein product [Polarella glacialis]|uniref:coproporphyrinogen oxidase n=1 Tax=Polarella glacialis TaxID=89957 RepID=A0A813IH87_POLGL|nr:unnamed protein product [Polarella glacialis]